MRRLNVLAMFFDWRRTEQTVAVRGTTKREFCCHLLYTRLLAFRLAGVDSLFIGPSHAAPAECGAFAGAPANHRTTNPPISAERRSVIMHATPRVCIVP